MQGAALELSSEGQLAVGAQECNWFQHFAWVKGAALEAFFDGEWWEADIIQLQDDHVMIHYVGGNEDEDEWILKTSDRLRPPQPAIMPEGSSVTTVITKKHSISGLNVRELDDHQRSKSADQRPMRQSRILSNDSRLAMQLQEQEVMAATAARGKAIHNRKKSRTQSHRRSTKSIVVERSANPAPASCDSSESIHDAEITLKSLQSSEWKQPSSPVNASAEGGVSLYKKQKKSHKGVVSEDGSGDGIVLYPSRRIEQQSTPTPQTESDMFAGGFSCVPSKAAHHGRGPTRNMCCSDSDPDGSWNACWPRPLPAICANHPLAEEQG
eukprot:CAMPEP_0172168450 /NCGR_PEP_ID=MMETSP1050-20130122/10151_1 /TAXON_ID=233186 /ORGANISM="Cryptomonas curvata, Strain CCAP979/52" /LENGTH=324 /DNA_ID=CAMNT_0012839387 /DNA_START=101 /DNA_END=1074 /DNA_ORIENTATION=+